MTRKNRSVQPDLVYHLIARFVGGEWFVKSDLERLAYLGLLRLHLETSDWRCLAYAVMSNHIHLALLSGKDRLRDWIRPVHNEFANWINERNERIGAVFVRGPNMRCLETEPEAVRRLISYIHCNPVRAGVVALPHESNWTSHRAYLGTAFKPPWLDVDLGLELAALQSGDSLDAFARTTPTDRRALEEVLLDKPRPAGRPFQSREDSDFDEYREKNRVLELQNL